MDEGFHAPDVFHEIPSGHTRIEIDPCCPLCERPFTDDEQARRVHARYQGQQRTLAEDFKRQIEAREAQARRAGAADAQAAHKETIDALVAEIAGLKDDQETKILEQTEQRVARAQAQHTARLALVCQENHRLKKDIAQLNRKVEAQTANMLGDSAELDHYHLLRAAFSEDDIRRNGKGKEGGDVLWIVRLKGRECGRILIESKNVRVWKEDYAVKLRADKIAARADYAICAVCKLPSGTEQVTIRENGEVFVCGSSACAGDRCDPAPDACPRRDEERRQEGCRR